MYERKDLLIFSYLTVDYTVEEIIKNDWYHSTEISSISLYNLHLVTKTIRPKVISNKL